MTQLARSRIRLACDARSKSQIKDTFTGASPDGWNSNDTQLEIGIFDAGTLVTDISNIQSLTVAINDVDDRKTAVVAPITVAAADLDNTVTAETWADGTKQHALIPLTNAQFNFDLGGKTEKTFWLAVYVTTADVPARTYTVGTSILRILEDGTPPTGAPAAGDPLYLDADQSDARYLRCAFSTETSPLMDVTMTGTGGSPLVDIETTNGDFAGVVFQYTHLETVVWSLSYDGAMVLGGYSPGVQFGLAVDAPRLRGNGNKLELRAVDTGLPAPFLAGEAELEALIVSGAIRFDGLPTADPAASGLLWIDSGGILKVSGY